MWNNSDTISKRLLSGGLYAASGRVSSAIITLAFNVLITRLLPPEAVGAYFLIFSIVFITALFAQLGTHQAIIRIVAGSKWASPGKFSRKAFLYVYFIVIIASAFVGILYVFSAGWIGQFFFKTKLIGEVASVTAAWIGLRAIQTLLSQTFRGFQKIGLASIFDGLVSGVFILLALSYVWIINVDIDLRGILIITDVALLLSCIIGFVVLKKYYDQSEYPSGGDLKGILKISLPLLVASLTLPGLSEAHIWILGWVRGEDVVATYGAAYRLARFVVMPLVIINSVIPPMIARFMAEGKKDSVERVLRATASVTSIPSLLVVVFLLLFANHILEICYGGFYAKGAGVLIVLSLAQAVNTISGSPGVLLMMSDRQSIFMRFSVVCGSLGVLTSFLLVAPLGQLGVALGVATGLISHNLGMWFYCKHIIGIKTHMGSDGFKDVIKVVQVQLLKKGV